jgi:hypothetical protein
MSEYALIALFLLVPLYSTWAAARAPNLFKRHGDRAIAAIVWTFIIQFLIFQTTSGHGYPLGASVIPLYLLAYFSFGLIPAIWFLGENGKATLLFALAGALGATLPTAVYAIGMAMAALT